MKKQSKIAAVLLVVIMVFSVIVPMRVTAERMVVQPQALPGVTQGTFNISFDSRQSISAWEGRQVFSGQVIGTFTGDLVNGVPHGNGTFTARNTPYTYTGQWENGVPHGRGEAFTYVRFWNGTMWGTFMGSFKNGMPHGLGTFVMAYYYDDAVVSNWNDRMEFHNIFVGFWENGLRTTGTTVTPSGIVEEGSYVNDIRDGIFRITIAPGTDTEHAEYGNTWFWLYVDGMEVDDAPAGGFWSVNEGIPYNVNPLRAGIPATPSPTQPLPDIQLPIPLPVRTAQWERHVTASGQIQYGIFDSETNFLVEGIITFRDGMTQEGWFDRDIGRLTKGIITWPGGQQEEGRFDRDTGRLLLGVRRLPGGEIHEGRFDPATNRLVEGTATFANGAIHSGTFYNSFLVEGKAIFADGTVREGRFERGYLVYGTITRDGVTRVVDNARLNTANEIIEANNLLVVEFMRILASVNAASWENLLGNRTAETRALRDLRNQVSRAMGWITLLATSSQGDAFFSRVYEIAESTVPLLNNLFNTTPRTRQDYEQMQAWVSRTIDIITIDLSAEIARIRGILEN